MGRETFDPSWVAKGDQVEAALRQTARLTQASRAETSDSGAVADALERWRSHGLWAGCKHARFDASVVLVGLLAGEVGKVYCPDCGQWTLAARALSAPDRCDVCDRVSKDFHELIIHAGPFVLLAGNVCPDCNQGGIAQ